MSKPIFHTGGGGLWTKERRPVVIEKFILIKPYDFDCSYGELRVYFDPNTWDTGVHGLIYTDPTWLHCFKDFLQTHNFSLDAIERVNYSEHGMQGKDFVSLDVGMAFMIEFDPFVRFMNGFEKLEANFGI